MCTSCLQPIRSGLYPVSVPLYLSGDVASVAVTVRMKLLSWTNDLDYKRSKRFHLGGWLGRRRHAGFDPLRTDEPGELDHLNSDSDEIDEYSGVSTEPNRA